MNSRTLYIYTYTSVNRVGCRGSLSCSRHEAFERDRVLVKFRAGWEREAEISYDRRHEGIPHDEGRPGHVAVRRPRLPCPGLQVSHGASKIGWMHLFFFFFFFFFFFLDPPLDSQSQWRAPAPNSQQRST